MVCPIQKNIVPFKIIVQITRGVNKQHNFTSLLKNLNALADIGNHTGGHSLLESYTTAFNRIMLESNGDFKQWTILLRGTFEIMAKKDLYKCAWICTRHC